MAARAELVGAVYVALNSRAELTRGRATLAMAARTELASFPWLELE
jgi:hypothetical protein